MHKHQKDQVTIINILPKSFLIGTISLGETISHRIYIKSLAETIFHRLYITSWNHFPFTLLTLARNDLGIPTLAGKDLGIINHHISHHTIHNQCIQAISHHMEETKNHTIQVHNHAFKHSINQSTRVTITSSCSSNSLF